MIGNGERLGGRRRDGPGRVAWTAAVALLVAVPVAAVAQVQPPPLDVYTNAFQSSSGPAPGSSSAAQLLVDVPGIDPLEVRLEELRQLMADHLAETSPHWEHFHFHAPHTAAVVPVPGHSELLERLARLVSDVFLRRAYAQAQPPPLRVHSEDWDAGSTPAPTGASGPPVRLVTDVPMLDTIDAQLRQLRSDINAHVGNVNAHPHDHPHTHGAGGTQFYHLDQTDTDLDGIIDLDDLDPVDPLVQ